MERLLTTNQELVTEFHRKIGAEIAIEIDQASVSEADGADTVSGYLRSTSKELHYVSSVIKTIAKDWQSTRAKRAELIVEELAETLAALSSGDEIGLADALADLLYVVYGTAVAYGIPIEPVFREVHRSNMTKDIGANKHHEGGTKGKGASYSPPDIAAAMDEGKLDSFTRTRVIRDLEEISRRFDSTPWSDKAASKVISVSAQEHESIRRCLP